MQMQAVTYVDDPEMVVFNKTTTNTEMEPLYPPQQVRSDDQSRMAEIRLRSPQRRTQEVDVGKLNNAGTWLNSPQRRSPAKVEPSLPPQQPAESRSKCSVPEVVMDVELSRIDQKVAKPDDGKEQQGRCLKYSLKALSFDASIMTVVRRHFITAAGMDNDKIAPGAVGILFFLTIFLGIYLILASTVRNPALNLPTKYLDVLLICLLLSTLIATVMKFSGANWKEKQSPAAGGSN